MANKEDKNIDQKLNELGIKTIRYVSDDFNVDLQKFVTDIDNLIECAA
jgi:hypothetical protein